MQVFWGSVHCDIIYGKDYQSVFFINLRLSPAVYSSLLAETTAIIMGKIIVSVLRIGGPYEAPDSQISKGEIYAKST